MSSKMKEVFVITDRKDDDERKTPWPKVGIAFVNKDDSINVILDAVPMTGKLHIRDRLVKNQNNKTQEMKL